MTTEDFKQLEALSLKLEGFLGKRCAIVPSGSLALPSIAVYENDGTRSDEQIGPTLEHAALAIKKRMEEKQ